MEISEEWLKVFPTLNESQKRWIAGIMSSEMGYGGIVAVAEATGLSRTTILKGVREVKSSKEFSPEKVREKGGGRKSLIANNKAIKESIEVILSETTAGDPMSSIRWTSKSVRKIAEQLSKKGLHISYQTVHNILVEMGYSLQSNRKSLSRENNPNRDRQFKLINRRVKKFFRDELPVISTLVYLSDDKGVPRPSIATDNHWEGDALHLTIRDDLLTIDGHKNWFR